MDTDRMDSPLIQEVNVSTAGHVVEWSRVVQQMRTKGHTLAGEEQCRQRMKQLVKRYLKVLIDSHSDYRSACNRWPLFASLDDMNLKPFFDPKDYRIRIIDHFRSLVVNDMPESLPKTSCIEPIVTLKKTSNAEEVIKMNDKSMVEKSETEDEAICRKDNASDTYSESVTNSYDSKQVVESLPPQKTYDHKTDSTLITKPMDNSYDSQHKVNESPLQKTNTNTSVNMKFLVDFDGNKFFITIDSLNAEYVIFDRLVDEIEAAVGSRIGPNTHSFEEKSR